MMCDRLRRLRLLYRALIDPAEARSIAELGADYDFFDQCGLSRSFRRAFGASPRNVRALATRAVPRSGPNPADRVRSAIGRPATVRRCAVRKLSFCPRRWQAHASLSA